MCKGVKWGYFNRIFKEKYLINKTIDTYNEIYDFRENIGDKYFKLCSIDNHLSLEKENKDLLKKKYKNQFTEINNSSKELYDKINKLYGKYLNLYLRFI
jgi:hypothetical protein